jgi:hypothetical protein
MNYSLLSCLLLAAACGGSDANLDLSSRDPRCLSACPETMPAHEGIGEVCDTASRAQCLDECEVRIAGVPTVCQSCLLEHADLSPPGRVSDNGCDGTTCTITSDFGTCTYPTSDQAAYLACLAKIDPRREVACTAYYRPVGECATSCP